SCKSIDGGLKDSTIIQDELGHLHPVWWYCTVFPLLYMPGMKYTYRICTVSYKLNEEEINAMIISDRQYH
ncbi:MAG: hypothetical protein JST09_14520, partial [Bacteroidetes bacterium]|nr:hypothetical protein [Bacteroidota bacterium]